MKSSTARRFSQNGGTLEMVQLWVNLPASEKMSQPRYQGLLDANIPRVALPNNSGTVRVIAGTFLNSSGAAKTVTPINVWDIRLEGEAVLEFPEGHTALAIVQQGAIMIGTQSLKAVELVEFERTGTEVQVNSQGAARLLVLTGQAIGEPVVGQGPFVMNTREQIQEAIQDYQAGRMGRLS